MILAAPLKNFWVIFSLTVVSGALIYILSVLFWGINRGFDLADEGFYLLLAKHPHQYPAITYFNVWLAFIPPYTVSRVLDFRYAQIVCQLLGSVWLSCAYLRALTKLNVLEDKVLLLCAGLFSVIGNLLLFAKFPFSISYNSLTGLFLFGATALIIESAPLAKPFCTQSLNFAREKSLMLISAGLLSGLCFSIKFSASLVFVLSALPLIFLFSGRAWRKPAVAFSIGVFLSAILTCTLILNPLEWWKATQFFMEFQAQHHGLHSSLLANYYSNVIEALDYFKPYLIPHVATTFVVFFLLARKKATLKPKSWYLAALLLHVAVWIALGIGLIQTDCLHHNNFSANIFFVVCMVLFCEIAGLHLGQNGKANEKFSWRVLLLNLAMFLLPVICAAGTRNLLPFQCTIFLAPTFLLLTSLSAILNNQFKTKLPTVMTLVVCSVVAVFQFYDGFVRHPYDLPSRLNTQTKLVDCKNLKGLRMEPTQAKFIEDTESILRANGFKDEDNILAFYQLPGLVYAVGGISPQLPWYSPLLVFREWNRHFVKDVRLSNNKKLFLIADRKLDPNILAGLSEAGVKFPADFKLLGSTYNPYALGTVDGVPDMNGKTNIYELVQK
jgi:hypothetical protein